MQSLSSIYEIFSKYPDSDKGSLHSYLEVYEKLFEPIREQVTSVLEVGVRTGGSLLAWRDYFPNAKIYGLDNWEETKVPWESPDPRITVAYADSTKHETLQTAGETFGPFDIVIDDGCHLLPVQKATYIGLSKFLKPNGIYVIEDFENLEYAIEFQQEFGGVIVDRRYIKNRHDDILVVLTAANHNIPFPT